jgi:hypothetical protein
MMMESIESASGIKKIKISKKSLTTPANGGNSEPGDMNAEDACQNNSEDLRSVTFCFVFH